MPPTDPTDPTDPTRPNDPTDSGPSPTPPLPPPAHPLRVVRYAKWSGYSPRQWAVAIARTEWATDAELLKAGDRGTVWRAGLELQKRTLDCVVKVEPCARFAERLRAKLGLSRFHRQWAGAESLHAAGIATGRPKAILLGGRGGAGHPSGGRRITLVLDAVPGRTVLEHAADFASAEGTPANRETVRTERPLATAITVGLAAMRRAGVRNRDHKPSNLVAQPVDPAGPDGPFTIAVIDTMGIERGLSVNRDAALAWHLACLMIEPTGVGCPPRRTLRMRVLRGVFDAMHPSKRRNRKRWRTWRGATWDRVGALVRAHGDPTPTDDPLA